jgi:hypothetical protein
MGSDLMVASNQTIGLTWTTFKDFADSRNLPMIWFTSNNHYFIYIADGPLTFETRIRIDTPANADQTDFENNYKNDANDTPIGNKIIGNDGNLAATVKTKDFENALVTTGTLTAEVVAGFDDFADSWFFIDTAGAIGDTLRVEIAAGAHDSTIPDRDHPAVDVTYTLVLADVGDEIVLRDNVINALNADSNFNVAFRAGRVQDNAIVHIGAKDIGEFGERPTIGDLEVTTTGTTSISYQNSDNQQIIRRNKENSGQRDPRDQRLVTQGISGIVQAVPGAAGDIFVQNATDDGTPTVDGGGTGDADLRVDGSVTPVEFFIPADVEKDIFITELRFYGGGNGIQFTQFLSKNGALTNGILVEIISDEAVLDNLPIRATEDFKNKWAFGSGANFRLDIVSGTDQMLAVLLFENPFPIRKAGTFLSGDDEIRVFIRDDIVAGLTELELLAVGFKREV